MPRSIRLPWFALLTPLTMAVGLTALCAAGPAPEPPPAKAKDPAPSILHKAGAFAAIAALFENDKDKYEVWNFEFKTPQACEDFKAEGIYVEDHFQEFAQVMVKNSNVFNEASLTRQGLIWGEQVAKDVIPPPQPFPKIGKKGEGTPEPTIHGGLGDLTGKGVLLAIVDTGIDFRHKDFQTDDGKSRLLYFWDTMRPFDKQTGQAAPVTGPDGTPFGTILARDDLNADLDGGKRTLGPADDIFHGTACAGIAGGRGAIDPKGQGVAPDVDLIAVRIGDHQQGLKNGFLLPAICKWLIGVAEKRKQPLVISCSFGGHVDSSHDGSQIEERWLDALLPDSQPGRLICIAGGNDGGRKIHAPIQFAQGNDFYLGWDAKKPEEAMIQIYLDGVQPADVEVTEAAETKFRTQVTKQVILPSNALEITVIVPPEGGLYLATPRAKLAVHGDAYLPLLESPVYFKEKTTINAEQIQSPATAKNAFAIGSYDFDDQFKQNKDTLTFGKDPFQDFLDIRDLEHPLKFGALSDYSNAGFLRSTQVVKPDLVAPGRYFTAPLSGDASIPMEMVGGTDNKYVLMDGTSAATPYTAGVFALLLQENPKLTGGELRKLLKRGVLTRNKVTDETRPCPNEQWGYGKLDVEAVKRLVAAVKPD